MADLNVNDIADAAGTGPVDLYMQSAAKVWAQIDQTGTTTTNGSFNVASVTDNATGQHTLTFSNAMADGDWGVGVVASEPVASISSVSPPSTTAVRVITRSSAFATADSDYTGTIIAGDLA